jgi:hypothetical protein
LHAGRTLWVAFCTAGHPRRGAPEKLKTVLRHQAEKR